MHRSPHNHKHKNVEVTDSYRDQLDKHEMDGKIYRQQSMKDSYQKDDTVLSEVKSNSEGENEDEE